jgi:anti-sigma regulatory factor (Ser/Thr protein kinase)
VVEHPGRLLEHLSDFAESVDDAHYATVCVAILDPETGEVGYAAAGHPPPLVVHADGTSSYLWHGRSEPLACRRPDGRPEALAMLANGSSLVLFTDGLVERRDELIDVGLERLRTTVVRLLAEGTADLADRILDGVLAEGVRDDDAVVLVATMGEAPVRVFHHELPRDASALAAMRQAARVWLEAGDVHPAVAHDLVLVLNEAAANAVEHGEGHDDMPIQVRLAYDPRVGEFEGTVTGAGLWREQRPSDRGRGLPIIRNLTDTVTLERRRGTTLSFRRSARATTADEVRRP